jgi:hypothetical protein
MESGFSFDRTVYRILPYFDFYTMTLPTIPITTSPPSTNLLAYFSHAGESLSYIWATFNLATTTFQNSYPISFVGFTRTMYNIVYTATQRLLDPNCPAAGPATATQLLTNNYITGTTIGFRQDSSTVATNGGILISPVASVLQSFLPFSPATSSLFFSFYQQRDIYMNKLLRCPVSVGNITVNVPVYVDPTLVQYYLFMFDGSDRSSMILANAGTIPAKSTVDSDLTPFIKNVSIPYTRFALFMNGVKLETLNS